MASDPGLAVLSPWDGRLFDPGGYVVEVNRLRRGSAAAALDAIADFARLHGADPEQGTRAFFLLRLLFVVPGQGEAPPVLVGAPTDATPPPAGAFPLYPLALVEDVPLLIVPGFELAGFPESPLAHVEYFAKHGQLRPAPLRPPDDPLGLADALLGSPSWHRGAAEADEDRALLRAQLLRLVRSAVRVQGVDDPDFYASLRAPGAWERHCAAFRASPRRWNGESYGE